MPTIRIEVPVLLYADIRLSDAAAAAQSVMKTASLRLVNATYSNTWSMLSVQLARSHPSPPVPSSFPASLTRGST